MKIETLHNEKTKLKIGLSGRLDMVGNQIFELELNNHLNDEHEVLIIDLSSLSFIASIGIRSLVAKAKDLAKNNKELILCAPKDSVSEVLETTGINSIIKIIKTCET